ncbi:hypothetical protein [Mucilaginibacter flavus]|uniref:hypothetical protein n=1 Tax=Mucilaginibacter flavus TaxID=931504 RepID=UPI0025B2BB4D|nr:hypothetical protein [Mucilaginibacter flavus]MDN3583525.1 hypothetical protein [Mucilaginibacter flavus]
MKPIYLAVTLLFCQTIAFAQTGPTLSAGLEALTYKKGAINVDSLTSIIIKKQGELKQEALKRFVIKLFPSDNITTKSYIQSSLNILINEKNPKVIEKEIIELTTNYALALGIAKAYKADSVNKIYLKKIFSDSYTKTSLYSDQLIKMLDDDKTNVRANDYKLQQKDLTNKAAALNIDINNAKTREQKVALIKQLKAVQKSLITVKNKLADIGLNLNFNIHSYNDTSTTIPFNIILDIASTVLSNNDSLQKKGFFKNKIDYHQAYFYKDLVSNGSELSMNMAHEFDRVYAQINAFISPYISNYDIIKEFFATKITPQKGISIKDSLIKKYVAQISQSVGDVELASLIQMTVLGDNKNLTTTDVDYKKTVLQITSIKKKTDTLKNLKLLIGTQTRLADSLLSMRSKRSSLLKDTSVHHYFIPPDSIGFLPGSNTVAVPFQNLNNQIKKVQKDSALQRTVINRSLSTNQSLLGADSPVSFFNNSNFKKAYEITDNAFLKTDAVLTEQYKKLAFETNYFYQLYLTSLLKKFTSLNDFRIENNSASAIQEYTTFLAQTYSKLNTISKQETVNISDIYYLEDEVIPNFIKYGVQFYKTQTDAAGKPSVGDEKLTSLINNFVTFSGLIKIRAIRSVNGLNNYNSDLVDLFKFVSNLDNLDQAQTYENMINLLKFANGKVEDNLQDGEFKDLYVLFINAIKKYTIVNDNKQYVQLDVASFLNELSQYYNSHNKSNFNLYLTLGLNQNFFPHQVLLPGATDKINNIGFASEKIGVKFRLKNYRLTNGYRNAITDDVNLNKSSPFINEWYFIMYGSGLLYSIANTSTEKNFNYPHIGIGTGFRFYNSLDVNLVVGLPFIKNEDPFKFIFLGFGLDIPLGEYLEKTGNK